MGRKGIKVNEINNEMLKVLESFSKKFENRRIGKISKALILSSKGASSLEISEELDISITTVISYINNWNDFGLDSLIEMRGGNRVSLITREIELDVMMTLKDKLPDQEGYNSNKWSCSLLSDYINKKYGIKYSKTSVHNLIKKLGFKVKWGNYYMIGKKR